MKKYYIPLLSLLCFLPVYGGAQQWNVLLSNLASFPTSYNVPAGKVFVVESVYSTGTSTSTLVRCQRTYNNVITTIAMDITAKDTYTSAETVWLPNKLRLKAGEVLLIPTVGTYDVIVYHGILLDEADLYAVNLPVELDNTRVIADKLMADAKVKSPRPHKLTVQSSPDMTGFTEDATAGVAATGTTGTSVVSVDKGATGKKFLRVAAQTRPRR